MIVVIVSCAIQNQHIDQSCLAQILFIVCRRLGTLLCCPLFHLVCRSRVMPLDTNRDPEGAVAVFCIDMFPRTLYPPLSAVATQNSAVSVSVSTTTSDSFSRLLVCIRVLRATISLVCRCVIGLAAVMIFQCCRFSGEWQVCECMSLFLTVRLSVYEDQMRFQRSSNGCLFLLSNMCVSLVVWL